jgi:hypothetical protein
VIVIKNNAEARYKDPITHITECAITNEIVSPEELKR